MPVGFKNATDGNVQVAADAMTSARHPHTFVGIDVDGVTCTIRTRGNPDRHVILRGGRGGTNHDADQVAATATLVAGEGVARPVMIDCSHGNSQKDVRNQLSACRGVLARVRGAGAGPLMGLLIESHLVEGRQEWAPGATLRYGQSITDACLGWGDTADLLAEAADAVRAARG
jgi:3-deoxy-7-phosphoheptulonate synthase